MVERKRIRESWLGVSIDNWIMIVRSLGVSTIIVLVMLGLAWKYVPPVVEAHIKLLDRTSETLQSMDNTMRQSNRMMDEIIDVERSTKIFIDNALKAHDKAQASLDKIERELIKDGS